MRLDDGTARGQHRGVELLRKHTPGGVAAALLALAGCAAPAPPPIAAPAPEAVACASGTAAPVDAPPAPSAAPAVEAPSLPPVEVVAVDASKPDGPPPSLAVSAPARGQVIAAKSAAAFAVKVSAGAWKLGERGNHLCVVLDKRGCRRVEDASRPLHLGDLDGVLDEGEHVVSVLARRGSGEFVRPSGKRAAFASVTFFVGKRTTSGHKDGAPMVFFAPADEGPPPPEGLLVDWYVANAEIAPGKYVVHASVGGPGLEQGVGLSLSAPTPLRVRNARPGTYLARFSLFQYTADRLESGSVTQVTSVSKAVPGRFAEVTRELQVAR